MTSASCCSSMVSPSANATAAGHRRYWAVAVLALALLHDPASAQARSGGAMPFREPGRLPKRLLHVRLLLRPAEQGQPAGGAEAAGGELPLRLVSVRCGLREIQSLRCGHEEWPLWA
jgi:hypothetical protein